MVAGGVLVLALGLVTTGIVAAADPNGSPGMMGGGTGSGMMGGGTGSGMMGGGTSSGMMGGGTGSGMMGGSGHMNLSADQLQRMQQLHEQMVPGSGCGSPEMQQLHKDVTGS